MDIKQFQEQYCSLKSQRDSIADEVKNLKDSKRKLSYVITDEQSSVEHIENTIDSLQETLSDLNSLLETHENEISDISDKLKSKDKELSDMNQQLADKKKQLDKLLNDELCKKSLTVNNKNSYFASLKKNTSTTPIVTEYCKSDKEFMVLNAGMRLQEYKKISYIIIRSNKTIVGMQENVPTMSEIKSVADKSISGVSIPRMQYLKNHIIDAASKCKNLTPDLIIPLSEPCPLGGQSDFNQTGYRWEWDWSYGIGDYTEGTYYGEMTGFSVIGIRINRSDYYQNYG